MFKHHTSVNCTTLLLFCLLILVSCATTPANPTPGTVPVTPTASATQIATIAATPTSTPTPTTPQHYTSHVIFKGNARPDDLVFDQQGHLLFSDFYNGTISRVNADQSVTILFRNIAGPEGLVVLSDGTMIIAEQRTNRILALPPGAQSPTVLRTLPGTPSTANCKDGVDGIALDPTTNTLIIPDSPTGDVYRMSLDGKTFTRLASGITRPVGAAVDAHDNIYVADECGGALWRITPTGATTHIGGFGMLDDVVLDAQGNLLVIDLLPSIHALIRLNPLTGKRQTLASQGFIEPQGLLIDSHGNIYVSDDYADIIVEYQPA
ncbi:MAG: Vgb family protein [Ktedonobacteraceae bacterium]